MGVRQALRQVVEEALELGREAECGVGAGDPLQILRPALLGQADAGARRRRQGHERRRQHVAQDPRALAAADHQQLERPTGLGRRIGLVATSHDLGADRIAGDHGPRPARGGGTLGLGEAQRQRSRRGARSGGWRGRARRSARGPGAGCRAASRRARPAPRRSRRRWRPPPAAGAASRASAWARPSPSAGQALQTPERPPGRAARLDHPVRDIGARRSGRRGRRTAERPRGRAPGARGRAPAPGTCGRRCRRPRSRSGASCGHLHARPPPRQRQEHAHPERQRAQRGAAVADERQGHAVRRHQAAD